LPFCSQRAVPCAWLITTLTLLYWWLDAYVDFDSEQKADVKQDIGEFFRWHRKTQLQDYVQFLQKAQQQLRGNPTQADLMADYVDIRDRTEALLLRSAPILRTWRYRSSPSNWRAWRRNSPRTTPSSAKRI